MTYDSSDWAKEYERLEAERDRLVKTGTEFYDAVALGPLNAAAEYGPDFDVNEHLQVKAAEFRAALDEARQG